MPKFRPKVLPQAEPARLIVVVGALIAAACIVAFVGVSMHVARFHVEQALERDANGNAAVRR